MTGPICALVVALAAPADGGANVPQLTTYTDEQLERCGPNIEHVRKIEARRFASHEEKAVAVDEAAKYLRSEERRVGKESRWGSAMWTSKNSRKPAPGF